ncbi:hypothetical protein AaE_015742 [Aphanomyces astaci]|uniref:Reverse transcriptase domain-containing protein n=1 Tax=Aphanomyces astaci TaxID=112090 RepID=A0A6A4YW13_APHAT|nr:hypothetical protein AaE_015742 [Aphanomyces astaci]
MAAVAPPQTEATLEVAGCFSALASESIHLRGRSRRLIRCHVKGSVADGTNVLMEQLDVTLSPLRVARSLNISRAGSVWVQIHNPSDSTIQIKAAEIIGRATILPPAFDDQSATTNRATPRHLGHLDSPPASGSHGSAILFPGGGGQKAEQDESPRPGTVGAICKEEIQIDWKDSSLSLPQREVLRKVLAKFDLFVTTSKAPGRTDIVKCHINTANASPIKSAPFRVTQKEGEIMEAEIKQYLDLGLIRKSTSPWASPVLMIRKPDGSIRFCIDYRKLNDVTVKDCYPMPRVDDLLDILGKAKYFSTMDVASGYWNVRMADDSIEKTAFTCRYGLYKWLVMPFGLCNAVPQFERLMEGVLQEHIWRTCLVYLDDVIIFSEDFGSHLVRLQQILTCLQEAGFKLKMSKCQWGKDKVAFLGHTVTPGGILPNPEKVKAVLRIKPLRNVAQVRSFLGLAGYFRRFIKGYAQISRPLESLKTTEVFEWTPECQDSLDMLKRKLASPPILAYPDFDLPFTICVDACPIALGAVLLQEQQGRHRVISYASQALDTSQQKWISKKDGTSEIECFGLVWATGKFRPYIDRRHFTVYTDHAALVWLYKTGSKSGNGKLARWAVHLQSLDFTVVHRPGAQMGCADGLSRLPIDPDEDNNTPSAIRWDTETKEFIKQPIPAGGPRACSISSGLVAAVTRSQSRHKTSIEVTRTAPEKATPVIVAGRATADEGPPETEEVPDPTNAKEREVHTKESARAEEVPQVPALLPPYRDNTYSLPDLVLRKEQCRDPFIVAMKAYLETKALPLDSWLMKLVVRTQEHYTLRDSVLYRRVILKSPLRNPQLNLVPVIPISMTSDVLALCHDSPLAGHFGRERTLERVRRIAYWHRWWNDVAEYCRCCVRCVHSGASNPRQAQ